jgi:APA family basic amino acid/polyamine antiporter
MGLTQATAMVVGIIVGSSIFVQPSEVSRAVPSFSGMLLVWVAAGALTWFGASICAELSSAMPRTGGVYVFLREMFSPAVGFLWGWAMFWSMHSGIIAAIAMVFGRYFATILPLGDVGIRLVAVAGILVLSAINYLGVKPGSSVQTGLTITKIAAIALLLVVLLATGTPRMPAALGATEPRGFLRALVAGLFAFGGWHMVTYAAEETRDPERTIPRALTIGVAIVTLCYIALNAAYFHVLRPDQIASSTRVAADAADAMLGAGGAALMSLVVAVSTFGALNGVILSGPRAYLAMARDRLLVSWAAAVHSRFQTPHRAILLQGLWAVILVSTGTYRALFTRVVYTEWLFFALLAAGLFRLRRRADYRPAYRVWGYPVIPVIFILSSAYIVGTQIVAEPVQSLTGLAFVAAGMPVYWLFVRKSPPPLPSPQHAD